METEPKTYTGGAAIHTYPGLPRSQILFDLEGYTLQARFKKCTKDFADRNALAYRELLPDGQYV